jgi:hypothetical protein
MIIETLGKAVDRDSLMRDGPTVGQFRGTLGLTFSSDSLFRFFKGESQ